MNEYPELRQLIQSFLKSRKGRKIYHAMDLTDKEFRILLSKYVQLFKGSNNELLQSIENQQFILVIEREMDVINDILTDDYQPAKTKKATVESVHQAVVDAIFAKVKARNKNL